MKALKLLILCQGMRRQKKKRKLNNKQVDLSDMDVQHKLIHLSDLPEDLVEEILSRIHITSLVSVRSTCKNWNVLSRNRVFGKANSQFWGFTLKDHGIFALRMDVQEILYDGNDLSNLNVKQVSGLNQIKDVYHCDGLLLCVLDHGLLVWNTYLGQKRWILHDEFNSSSSFAFGYDNYRNRKIFLLSQSKRLSMPVFRFNMYEFSSNSWRSINITHNWKIQPYPVTLKGDAYFIAQEAMAMHMERSLVCFDFTSERFRPPLSLPFHSNSHADVVVLSCVRDEQLAVLHQRWQNREIMKIWITNKIDYNEVLWTKWMEVDMNLVTGFTFDPWLGSIFIDKENEVTVIFGRSYNPNQRCLYQTAHIIGQDGSSKSINFGDAKGKIPKVIGYFPSLIQIE